MAGHLLGGQELPSGMLWVDEFAWSSVQKGVERSITGAQIVDVAAKVDGRPITLKATDRQGWLGMTRAKVKALQVMVDTAGGEWDLVLADGRIFRVQFAPENPLEASPIATPELPADTHPYVATLRLITV